MKIKFSDLFFDDTKNGVKLKTIDYAPKGKFPIIDQGQKHVAGYTNRKDGVYKDVPVIVFGDHTRIIKFIDQPFFLGADGVKILKPKKRDIDLKYLYYALESVHIPNTGYNRHFKWLKGAYIPVFSLEINDKIVKTLDKITILHNKYSEILTLFDELIKSRFIELFGDPVSNPFKWEKTSIKHLVTVDPQNGLYKPQSDYSQDKSGVPILRIDAFYDGKITNFETLKRLKCSNVDKKRYLLKENDIVINRVNSIEYLGKCAHITGMLEDTIFESNMMRFHLDDKKIDAVFMTRLLCSKYIYNQILRTAKKSVNQASINQKDVLGLEVYMPPIELQKKFAAFACQVDKSRLAVQKSLDELEILKKSLLQEYFG